MPPVRGASVTPEGGMLNRALLRDAAAGVWMDFLAPEAVLIANAVTEVDSVLARVDDHCRRGGYAAGYLSYEAAQAMDPAYCCPGANAEDTLDALPLAVFGLFAAPILSFQPNLIADLVAEIDVGNDAIMSANPDAGAAPGNRSPAWQCQEAFPEYAAKIGQIRQEIGAGNLYQANYTLRLLGQGVSAGQLFQQLGRTAPYGAFLDLDNGAIVSGSPELFFRLDDDRLESRPMKGTVARGQTSEQDAARRRWLEQSAKNRAENLMITDMVRNDVGRIARTGTVRTESIFDVQPLPTVWQMTSTVHAETDADLPTLFRALYPAASITGAPKVASMRLISALEDVPRGIYTGAIGYVGPGSTHPRGISGLKAQFNVAIRTAWVSKADGAGIYGAGGGIVWDSCAEEEFEEVALKSRVLTSSVQTDGAPVELLETIGWSPGSGFDHLPAHLERLTRAARHFGIPLDLANVRRRLEAEVDTLGAGRENGESARWRVRLCLGPAGELSVSAGPVQLSDRPQAVMLAREPVWHADPGLGFKTTRRGLYERAAATVPEGVEALLWNELGRVTESSIANLVYELDGEYFTPPLSDGLLPGVLRGALLDAGRIRERALLVQDIGAVDALHLVNGLRGWRQARLLSRGA